MDSQSECESFLCGYDKARHIPSVDRFQQQRPVVFRQPLSGISKIADEGFAANSRVRSLWDNSRHGVKLPRAQRERVLQSLVHGCTKFFFASGNACDAAFAAGPVTGGHIEKDDFNAR